MGEEVLGRDVGVERAGILEVFVPEFIDCVADELGDCALCGFERRVISNLDCMRSFSAGTDNRRGIGGDGRVVGRWAGG